jgi:hypothetical protein
MRLAFSALFLIACGEVHFVDPNPPQLFRAQSKFIAGTVDEPIVWVSITNLFTEDAAACAGSRQTTLGALRAAFASVGGQQLELPAQDLAPGCNQRNVTKLDVAAVQAAFAGAQSAFPGSRIRPVVVYLDNINAQVDAATAALILSLKNGPGGLQSLIWTVAFDAVGQQLGADRRISWTYTGDPALASQMQGAVSADLPLRTTAALTSGPVPLLDDAQLQIAHEIKVCLLPKDLVPDEPPALGKTQLIDRARPPTLTFQLPQAVAMPRSLYTEVPYAVVTEGCSGNCDRYYVRDPDDTPERWDEMKRCAMVTR